MKRFVLFCFILFAIGTKIIYPQKSADNYKLLTDKSMIEWEGRKVIGSHFGKVKFISGTLQVQNNLIIGGEFIVDMTMITNTDIDDIEYRNKLVNHLNSEDFFNVSNYPKSFFKITKTEPYTDKDNANINFKIYGEMTIKGIKNPISFPAIIRFGDSGIYARAKFSIDRTKWNIRYKSASIFSDLGDKFIYDDIWFKTDLYFSR